VAIFTRFSLSAIAPARSSSPRIADLTNGSPPLPIPSARRARSIALPAMPTIWSSTASPIARDSSPRSRKRERRARDDDPPDRDRHEQHRTTGCTLARLAIARPAAAGTLELCPCPTVIPHSSPVGCGNDALWKSQNDFHKGLEISHRTRDFHISTSHSGLNSLRNEHRRPAPFACRADAAG